MITRWYRSLPRLTRYWFTTTVVVSCLVGPLEMLPVEWMKLDWNLVYYHWEWWRCLTSIVAYPINSGMVFRFVLHCHYLLKYSAMLENQFERSPAAYLYLLIIVAVLANVAGFLFKTDNVMKIAVMSVLYIGCRLQPDVTESLFGTRFKALHLPLVLVVLDYFIFFSLQSFYGICIGDIYHSLKFHYPNLLDTPRILKNILPDVHGDFSGAGEPSGSSAAAESDPETFSNSETFSEDFPSNTHNLPDAHDDFSGVDEPSSESGAAAESNPDQGNNPVKQPRLTSRNLH
ncbi:derlin-1-like [Drosophila kikkawai]|uniref:Derlin n=1 Tax=Drosophila kikkawai TaxID=30033 RepID=A0ABM3C6K2_DROKI|nr:derlin-1-like [Drosophila kikkawai]